jgi:hypothetical protein
MNTPTTTREFSARVRREIRTRVSGAKISIRTNAVTFPTGARGYVSRGTATAHGKTAQFVATGNSGGFWVTFSNEEVLA